MEIKNAAIYLNTVKEQSLATYETLSEVLNSRGIKNYPLSHEDSETALKKNTDFMFCLGGDGTLLKAARLAVEQDIKIMGVNNGTLGFLSSVEAGISFDALLKDLENDNFIEQKRMLLNVVAVRENSRILLGAALNDCVIKTGQPRAIYLDVSYNNSPMKEYFGDGLIISTPTGSTAYSLAAGGPIVYPGLDVLILTPVCPHSLSQRPIVLPPAGELSIKLSSKKRDSSATLSLDGQINFNINYQDTINVVRNEKKISILYPKDYDFLRTLSNKLKWGSR
ncbi:MAG: NAD(+)/NADH kinase [Elusimicrobiota bacterium]|jgi:NAD+ kinase|nr:NAD(+)/NADH kinase [Elusimicrobiota bacterium]